MRTFRLLSLVELESLFKKQYASWSPASVALQGKQANILWTKDQILWK
jgi:hypothetical protein